MKATRFMRKPFYVTGYKVTLDNMNTIARWCDGHVIRDTENPFVLVPVTRPTNKKQTEAYVDKWVLLSMQRGEKSFKVYEEEWLLMNFFELPDDDLIELSEANPFCGENRPPSNMSAEFRTPTN